MAAASAPRERDLGKDLGDPLFQTWQIAWIGHALIDQPLDLWQANTFWPYDDTLAFSDALIGYAPAGLVAQAEPVRRSRRLQRALPGGIRPRVRRCVSPGPGARHRSRRGRRRRSSLRVRALEAHPERTPARALERRHPARALPAPPGLSPPQPWPGSLRLVGRGVAGHARLLPRSPAPVPAARARPGSGGVARTGRAGAARSTRHSRHCTRCCSPGFHFCADRARVPTLRVLDAHPEARRTAAYVATYSPRLESFLAAPEESRLWSRWTVRARAPLPEPDEMSLFPGVSIAALALVGAIGGVLSRRLRTFGW